MMSFLIFLTVAVLTAFVLMGGLTTSIMTWKYEKNPKGRILSITCAVVVAFYLFGLGKFINYGNSYGAEKNIIDKQTVSYNLKPFSNGKFIDKIKNRAFVKFKSDTEITEINNFLLNYSHDGKNEIIEEVTIYKYNIRKGFWGIV